MIMSFAAMDTVELIQEHKQAEIQVHSSHSFKIYRSWSGLLGNWEQFGSIAAQRSISGFFCIALQQHQSGSIDKRENKASP